MNIKEYEDKYDVDLESSEFAVEMIEGFWQCQDCGEWEIETRESGKSANKHEGKKGVYPICERCAN